MSQVSKRVLNPKIQERLFENFWEMFADIKNVKDIRVFLDDFLSPTEKMMLAKRMAIAILFSKGYDHRTISSMLKVSTTTVNNIARYLNSKTAGYQLLIKKYAQKESIKRFIQELERYFYRLQPGQHFVDKDLIKVKLGHKRKPF